MTTILPENDPLAGHPDIAALDAADDGVFGRRADFIVTWCENFPDQREREIETFASGEIHRTRAENMKKNPPGYGRQVICGTCGKDVHTRRDGQPRKHKCVPVDNPANIIHRSHPDMVQMGNRIIGVLHTARVRLDAELARVDTLIAATANPAMRTVTAAYRVGVLSARDDITHMITYHRDRPEYGTLPSLAELRSGTDGNAPGRLRAVSKVAISGYENGIALAIGALIAANEGA